MGSWSGEADVQDQARKDRIKHIHEQLDVTNECYDKISAGILSREHGLGDALDTEHARLQAEMAALLKCQSECRK